jgi:hypothetical protein
MLFGSIIVLIVAGLAGWWFGSYRASPAWTVYVTRANGGHPRWR